MNNSQLFTTMLKTVLKPFTLFFLLFIHTSFPANATSQEYIIEISKSNQELLVKNDDVIVKRYRIAHGSGGKGTKYKKGDKKTPIGVYKIMDFKAESRFHFFMQLNYPNLLDAWGGYKNKIISAQEFDAIATAISNKKKPPQDTILGGYIGIHGLGEENPEKLNLHRNSNWTEGCIALTNKEIIELRQYVDIGTKVVIKE